MTMRPAYPRALGWRHLAVLVMAALLLAASAARNLNGQGSESDLAAELADVEIMTEQLRLQGMDRLIDFHKQKKLERLAARLGVIYTNE